MKRLQPSFTNTCRYWFCLLSFVTCSKDESLIICSLHRGSQALQSFCRRHCCIKGEWWHVNHSFPDLGGICESSMWGIMDSKTAIYLCQQRSRKSELLHPKRVVICWLHEVLRETRQSISPGKKPARIGRDERSSQQLERCLSVSTQTVLGGDKRSSEQCHWNTYTRTLAKTHHPDRRSAMERLLYWGPTWKLQRNLGQLQG